MLCMLKSLISGGFQVSCSFSPSPKSCFLLHLPCRGESHACYSSNLLLGTKQWCFTTPCPMQGKANPLSQGEGVTTIHPRPEFSSCSPYSQVPPEPPPSTFPKQVAQSWAAQVCLPWRMMIMVFYRDLFSSRKRDGPSGTLLSLS